MYGWIKLHRKLLDNPSVLQDAEYLALWVFLLLSAEPQKRDLILSGKHLTLLPGQLISSRRELAAKLNIKPSKVHRILDKFESEGQITSFCKENINIISIKNWADYQGSKNKGETPSETPSETPFETPSTSKKPHNNAVFQGLKNKSETPFETPSETPFETPSDFLLINNLKNLKEFKENIYLSKEKYKKEKFSSSSDADFETLWSVYPRKALKSDAKKAFTKAVNAGCDFNSILIGAKAYADYVRHYSVESRYIKLLSNFIKSEAFNDDWKISSDTKAKHNKFRNTSQKGLDGAAVEKAAMMKLMMS